MFEGSTQMELSSSVHVAVSLQQLQVFPHVLMICAIRILVQVLSCAVCCCFQSA
jgi:hypothetical protein